MKPRTNKALSLLALGVLTASAAHAQSAGRARKPKVTPTPAAAPAPVAAAASDPEALEPAPPTDKGTATLADAPPSSETEILAMQGATFSSKERVAVFEGDVRVTDPRFQLACDELTVYLKKGGPKPAPAPADGSAPAATPAPLASPAGGAAPTSGPADDQSAMGGGIDHAIAKGHVIIVQERAATDGGDPKRSVGRGERADFDNNTGDMVLHGLPAVEQNGNTHVATSPNTVMTLRRDNSLTTKGPSRTLITQHKSADTAPGAAASPAAATRSPGL